MERLNHLLRLPEYRKVQSKIADYEQERIYCRHGIDHFRDVARVAYILSLEEQLLIDKELIYVTAFLHDIGRMYEYEGKCSHESGSILLALNWLPDCGFHAEEIKIITDAIAAHGKKHKIQPKTLGDILYRADKLSRDCFQCKATDTCKWTEEQKNKGITY